MRVLIAVVVLAPLCGCGWLEDDVARTHDRSWYFNTPAAYMTADARIVTQRTHPLTGKPVVCVEPSPDAIKAISSSGSVGIKGGNGAVTGGIDLSGTSGEAAAELAGRSTALLGLREGIFRACEAYSNGIIGDAAYALILAKYAPTMTTLFLGQDITGAAGVARAALTANAPAPSASSAEPATATATATTPAPGAAKKVASNASLASRAAWLPRIWPAQSVTPAAPPPPTALAATTPKPQVTPPKTDSAQMQTEAAESAGISATAALSLVRMNEDYMLQPQSLLNTLIVACIEESDPTRLGARDSRNAVLPNQYLTSLCKDIDSLDGILKYSSFLSAEAGRLHLVDPVMASATPNRTVPLKAAR